MCSCPQLWNSQPSPALGPVCGLHPNKMGWTMCESCDSCTSLCVCSCMNTHACGCTVCKDICANVWKPKDNLGYPPMRPITLPVSIRNLTLCATPLNYNWCVLPHQSLKFFFFLKVLVSFIFILCVWLLCIYVCISPHSACLAQILEKGMESPGIGVAESC